MREPTNWEVFDNDIPLLGALYSPQRVRMVAFGLSGGGLCVMSPGGRIGDDAFLALEKWGKPRALLAPNHFHNGGIAEWAAHPRPWRPAHRSPGRGTASCAPRRQELVLMDHRFISTGPAPQSRICPR